ncbi:MAG TPA: hypothetical protein VFW33_10450, partial [Gemmataceae bacterium]|nr:hypothetical protein [Gemmataceae bacterium]
MTSRFVARLVTGIAFVAACMPSRADEKPTPDDLVRAIHAEWSARQQRVKTIKCRALVDSFYPRGYLSATDDMSPESRQGKPLQPEEDKRFVDEPYSLAIDFAARRVRKEYEETCAWYNSAQNLEPEFFPDHSLLLFADNKYRHFRPKDRVPTNAREGSWDVVLYEGGATDGMLLGFRELPLLWVAGSVNGQMPSTTQLQQLEGLGRFSGHGDG